MRFTCQTDNKRLMIVTSYCNAFNDSQRFKDIFTNIKTFNPNYTDATVNSKEVYKWLTTLPLELKIYTYHNRWTRANGYTLPDQPGSMWINTAKLNRSDASIMGTIFHEAIHFIQAELKARANIVIEMGHGNNTPKMTHDKYTFEGGCVPEVVADVVYLVMSGLESSESSGVKHG